MCEESRVEWQETRNDQLVFVEGIRTPAGWAFKDRSTWDVCWTPCVATSALISEAEAHISRAGDEGLVPDGFLRRA